MRPRSHLSRVWCVCRPHACACACVHPCAHAAYACECACLCLYEQFLEPKRTIDVVDGNRINVCDTVQEKKPKKDKGDKKDKSNKGVDKKKNK